MYVQKSTLHNTILSMQSYNICYSIYVYHIVYIPEQGEFALKKTIDLIVSLHPIVFKIDYTINE